MINRNGKKWKMKIEKKAKEKNFDFLTVTKAITKSLYP